MKTTPTKKRSLVNEKPLSEDTSKITDDWSVEQCIEELQRIAKLDVDKVVSRNYFRVHSRIAESVWNRHFGTFAEYKRQAGIVLSRQQHAMEKAVAKHASVDHYRQLSIDRADYGNKFVIDRAGRFKAILACSDVHDVESDPFWLRVFIDVARRLQPDVLVFVGDIFDLPEFGKYGVDPREWDVNARIRFVHEKILAPLREACPNSQFDFIEGNHEARLLKHLADQTPALRAVLADLHGMTVPKLLGLDRFQINYVAQADLAAFTQRDMEKEVAANYKVYWDAFLCHHFPHARDMGLPGVNGHHHRHQVWPFFNPIYGAYEWHQMGCGHRRKASYTAGEKWHMGFDIAHVDTHTRATLHDYVTVSDIAVAGGQMYCREPHEVDPGVMRPLLMK